MSPATVFISYVRASSKKPAESLRETLLSQHGIASFLDSQDIEQSETFPNAIAQALLDCRVFVAFVDDLYFTKSWYCSRELSMALSPYVAARTRNEPEAARYLGGIIIALPPQGAPSVKLEHLLPDLRIRNWPTADRIDDLVALVKDRLASQRSTL